MCCMGSDLNIGVPSEGYCFLTGEIMLYGVRLKY